jgi:hypothetical protein
VRAHQAEKFRRAILKLVGTTQDEGHSVTRTKGRIRIVFSDGSEITIDEPIVYE